MKPAFVSLTLPLLLLVPPEQGQPDVVVRGRVTNAATNVGIEAANVRIIDAGVSVGTDTGGMYGIVMPDQYRGREVTLQVRAIGFKPASQAVKLLSDTSIVDFALAVDVNRLSEVVVTGTTGATGTVKFGFSVSSGNPAAYPPAAANPGFSIITTPQHLRGRHNPVDNTESYDRIVDNPFLGTRDNPLSTFSVDVDRASYTNIRRFVAMGQRPPKDAVRIEEMLNYFNYNLPDPDDRHPFSVTTEVGRAPWNREHLLVRVGLQARRLPTSSLPPSNLVFLVDVSGSMDSPEKSPLVKDALGLLVSQLRESDRVAIVVYAGAAGLVLPSTPGDQKAVIASAINRLQAGGSTAGGAGIRLAYDIAKENHLRNGNNRVILATDGDFNVGASSDAEMERLIEEKRKQGTFLSVLGFGMGN
jgi:Ca-activated chloride channel family protein